MFSKGLVKSVLAVFIVSIVAIGSGFCADVVNQDARKAEMIAQMSILNALRFSKDIGLSDQQQQDIKAIQKQSRDSVQALMADFRAKRGEMGSVGRSSSTVAMANARAKMDDMSKQLMDMRKAETDKISAVLTADQKTKLTQLTETDMNNAIEKMKANAKSRPAQMNATQTKPAITQVKPVIGQKK